MTDKLQKLVNLALGTNNEGEASNAARMFFKKLASLNMKFSSKTWGLDKEQSLRLASLGGVELKIKTEVKPTESIKYSLSVLLESIRVQYGVTIPANKARSTLRRKMPFYPGTQFTVTEVDVARKILVDSFC